MVSLFVSAAMASAFANASLANLTQIGPNWGQVKHAPKLPESAHSGSLAESAGLKRLTQWKPVVSLSPAKTRSGISRLIFYRPSALDAGGTDGIADMLGLPGGWHSEPGDKQSYLLVRFPMQSGKRYGMVFEISRYSDNSGPATYSFDGSGGKKTRNLTGPGHLYYSFVAPASGDAGVFLRMETPGRYLFLKVNVTVAFP